MHSRRGPIVRWTFASLLAVIWLVGCGKNKQEAEVPASPPSTTQAAQTGASPVAPNQPAADNRKTYSQVESSLKTKDYVGAVDAALTLGRQQQQMTAAQAQAVRNQMIRLQASVASGVA